jgi:hypothetical protein
MQGLLSARWPYLLYFGCVLAVALWFGLGGGVVAEQTMRALILLGVPLYIAQSRYLARNRTAQRIDQRLLFFLAVAFFAIVWIAMAFLTA